MIISGDPLAVSQSTVQNNELAEQHTTELNDASDAINNVENNKSANANSAIHSGYSDSDAAWCDSDLIDNDDVIKGTTDADRLTHFGDSDFHYDEFGNQIRETGKGIKTRREYNAFNQLSCFNNNGTLTQYDYDPLGRRIAKHTEQGKIDYIWDNDQLIGEYQHGEYTWYINLPNQFHPVALIKQDEVYYYHLDQLNTPRFVTNNKAEVVWENQANVYGYEESEISNKNSFTQPIRFQGQYLDEESGLHYNRYRYYSPKQQRFINQDPIGLVGGINHYQYAPNPVNWVDPFGLLCKEGQAKVKEALDSDSVISEDLKKKIIAITQLEESGYTADEMVEHINAGTVGGLVDTFDSSPKYGGQRTIDGGRDSTNSVVYKDPKTKHLDDDEARKPTFVDGVMLPLKGTSGKAKPIPLMHEKSRVVERIYEDKKNGTIKTYRINKDENAMPEFTIFETYLDESHINSKDEKAHFQAANERLGELLQSNPNLKEELGLTNAQYKHLTKNPASKIGPPELTWHHHQNTGKIQLVNEKLHARFGHVGGMERWGGGRK